MTTGGDPPSTAPARLRDFSRDSWRLKLARAEHHMKELELEVARYVGRHPYKATRLDDGDPKAQYGRWILTITEKPPDQIAIVLGDVLTNIRASLDHIATALAPGEDRNFPLVADPQPEGGIKFTKAVKGMPSAAIAIIEELQPYNFISARAADGSPQVSAMRELTRLVNADKHDGLIPIATSVAHAWSLGVAVGEIDGVVMGGVVNRGFYAELHDEGHAVADFKWGPLPPGHEMQVHIHGTPRISVDFVKEPGIGNAELLSVVRLVLDILPGIFSTLEAHIPL